MSSPKICGSSSSSCFSVLVRAALSRSLNARPLIPSSPVMRGTRSVLSHRVQLRAGTGHVSHPCVLVQSETRRARSRFAATSWLCSAPPIPHQWSPHALPANRSHPSPLLAGWDECGRAERFGDLTVLLHRLERVVQRDEHPAVLAKTTEQLL